MFLPSPSGPIVLTPEKVVTDADVYERAAEVVVERGWTTGVWEDDNGRVCMLGAIAVAAIELGHPSADLAERFRATPLLAVSERLVGGDASSLWRWNDGMHFWQEKRVIRRLKKMARRSRRRGKGVRS
jgi:hypothetical protein